MEWLFGYYCWTPPEWESAYRARRTRWSKWRDTARQAEPVTQGPPKQARFYRRMMPCQNWR